MPHTASSSSASPSTPVTTGRPVLPVRVDNGHAGRVTDPDHREPVQPAGAEQPQSDLAAVPDVSELDRRQLAQLAQRLQQRHLELCRQQETLNAQIATLDQERRRERMWLQEREIELTELESRLRDQTSELGAEQVQALQEELERMRRERDTELDAMRRQVAETERLAEEHEQRWRARLAEVERSARRQLDRERHEFEDRQRAARDQLYAIENSLREQTANLQRERETWEQERESADRRLRRRREAWVRRWAHERRALATKKHNLRRLSAELQEKQAAQERLAADLHQYHAELLQERLAVETALGRLDESPDSARRAQLLSALRQRLDEELQWSQLDAQRRQDEMRELASRVESRSVELAERRQALLQWLKRRQEDLDAQTNDLAAREQQLEQQRHAWEARVVEAEQRCRRAEAQLRAWIRREYQ